MNTFEHKEKIHIKKVLESKWEVLFIKIIHYQRYTEYVRHQSHYSHQHCRSAMQQTRVARTVVLIRTSTQLNLMAGAVV